MSDRDNYRLGVGKPFLGEVLSPDSLNKFKDQLLIAMVKRLAKDGKVVLPVSEVDATGDTNVGFEIDKEARIFTLTLEPKH